MDPFNKYLKQLDSEKNKNDWSGHFTSRKFPKQAYQKATHHIWFTSIFCVMLLIAGGCYGWNHYFGDTGQTTQESRPARHVKHVPHAKKHTGKAQKLIKPSDVNSIGKPSSGTKITSPKQGERLLGKCLNKLHYPTAKGDAMLNTYQGLASNKAIAFSRRLSQLASHPGPQQHHQMINLINRLN